MKPEMMQARTLEQLSALDEKTKQELLAFVRNRLTCISGQAQLAAESMIHESARAKALMIARDCARLAEELTELFKVQKENTHVR